MANAHPFATAGGGTTFENRVVCLFAVDLLCSRHTQLGGLIASIAAQSGPLGFEDLEIGLERSDGSAGVVHVQCRHRQTLTGADHKFKALLEHAWSAVSADRAAYASGHRTLLLVVDESSPGHWSLAELCRLARTSQTADLFDTVVARHGGSVAKRLEHCRAASGLPLCDLHSTLAALDVCPVALDHPTARDAVELINRLQALWSPADPAKALALAQALFAYVCDLTPRAGTIDTASLEANLRASLPGALGAGTRRARLHQLQAAGEARVARSLRTLGVEETRATELALRALNDSPAPVGGDIVVLDGPMGVGKTTELERQHRQAIRAALADPTRPIPVFLHARDLARATVKTLVNDAVSGLGDPTKVGVHLAIDGLDEVGLTVDNVVRRVADADAQWPNSTVVLATRPQPAGPGTSILRLEPLSADDAEQLMTTIYTHATHWLPTRAELTEVLRRPLFAISYAIERRDGKPTRPADLVKAVGERAVRDLDGTGEDSFALFQKLACAIVESGGQTVDLAAIRANPLQAERVARSRVVEVVDGRATFHLAVLTEWFAATAILADPAQLESCVSSPLAAYRWRYALVEAIRQGSDTDADRIMTELLGRVPATAAWVFAEAVEPFTNRRATPLPGTTLEIGARIRHASKQWLDAWPTISAHDMPEGEMATLGIDVDEDPQGAPRIASAWRVAPSDSSSVLLLPDDAFQPEPRTRSWNRLKSGRPVAGSLWAWEWTRDGYQRSIDSLLQGQASIARVSVCWAEVAWDYAHCMLDRSAEVATDPIPLHVLEERVDDLARSCPPDAREVHAGNGRRSWRLSDGRAFVGDLRRLSIEKIDPPWPAPDARGGWISNFWTTERLLHRLHLATKAALDAYRELVEQHVPRMAPELSTYQLLPARIVGEITEGDPNQGMLGQPHFSWHIEPLESGAENQAAWTVVDRTSFNADLGQELFKELAGVYRRRRETLPALTGLALHGGEPHIYSPTPAGSLALSLLASDLTQFKWTSMPYPDNANARPARPVSR